MAATPDGLLPCALRKLPLMWAWKLQLVQNGAAPGVQARLACGQKSLGHSASGPSPLLPAPAQLLHLVGKLSDPAQADRVAGTV